MQIVEGASAPISARLLRDGVPVSPRPVVMFDSRNSAVARTSPDGTVTALEWGITWIVATATWQSRTVRDSMAVHVGRFAAR